MIDLGAVYTEEIWIRGGKVKEHKKYIGKQYISWSRVETFNDKAGFNTGLLGEFEYILNKMSGITFPDMGWGHFGHSVETFITKFPPEDVEVAKKEFNQKEVETLNKIKPLGHFQDEICYYVKELDMIVLGYIDDRSPEKEGVVEILRDYKTKSESSKKDLHDPKKHQLELYILGLQQRGLTVKNAEYCVIERFGGKECMFGGGRDSLSVGDRIWYEPYSWDEDRLKVTHQMIIDTALRISSIYGTYQKFFSKEK